MDEIDKEIKQKIESTIDESKLPCPRLELRWVKEEYETRCEYNFVIPIFENDIRVGSQAQHGSELRFCMGWTKQSGGPSTFPMYKTGEIDTPYRDGKHIQWDSYNTGFPAFVVWNGKAQSILPEEHKTGLIEEKCKNEDYCGGKNWAYESSYYLLKNVANVIRRHASKVKQLRDLSERRSWRWIYYNWMHEKLMEKIKNIDSDCGLTDFEDWLNFYAYKIKIDIEKRVCGECGKEIPDNIQEACEHVFEEDDRKFLEEK